MSPAHELTSLLVAARNGDRVAEGRFWELVHAEVRRIAESVLAGDGVRRYLQPTELINEAYIRLIGDGATDWKSRHYFYAAAGRAMRQICVDYARKRRAAKRGGGKAMMELNDLSPSHGELGAQKQGAAWPPEDLLALDEALERFERLDPERAEAIVLHYFAGRSIDETAEMRGVSPRKIDADLRAAKAWLRTQMTGRS